MKGLLLKDFYMTVKYCRILLVFIVIFSAASLADGNMGFFSTFPVLMAGMLPVTLLSYDEKEKWHIYSGTFPYSRTQIVSSKYIFGLLATLSTLILSASVLAVRSLASGTFAAVSFLSTVAGMLAAGLAGSALVLPFIFKLGAEKGRIMYYVVIIAVFALGAAIQGVKTETGFTVGPLALIAMTSVGAAVLFTASWIASVFFYRKREL